MDEAEGAGRAPKRIWWARPRKLCALERPGGGGRSHRPERRQAELAYLAQNGVRLIVSTMTTRHNLADYEAAGLDWHHVPVESAAAGADALEELLSLLRRELRVRGAVAVHGNRHTDFVAAVCAAHLHQSAGVDPVEGLGRAGAAGLTITPDAAALVGVSWDELRPALVDRQERGQPAGGGGDQPRARMAASTSSGPSVTT